MSSATDPLDAFSPETLPATIGRIRSAGIASQRLCSPDVVAQLEQALARTIDSVICVALDTDPRVPLQSRTALESAPEIAFACRALARALGDARAVVAIDRASAGRFARQTGKRDRRLRFVALDPLYPLAHPTLLLKVLLRRRLPPGRPVGAAGVLLLDAVAAAEIGRALLHDQPADMLTVMVCDHASGGSRVARVPREMTVAEVLEFLALDAAATIYDGPTLRGKIIAGRVPVRDTERVLHLVRAGPAQSPEPCTRCGKCVDVCPVRLQPASLLQAAQDYDESAALHFGVDACLTCGLCDAVCPSALPIASSIFTLRTGMRIAGEAVEIKAEGSGDA